MCECSDKDTALDDTWEETRARSDGTNLKIYPANRSPGGRTELDTTESWHSIVAMYTSTSLTKESDKLPALSGLAKAMLGGGKDEYLAGLWKSSLKYNLLWKLSSSPLPKPKAYRAPSWSWASVDGRVSFEWPSNFRSSTFACEVRETHCEASTIDEYGQVCDGKLVLAGRLLRGTFEYGPSAPDLRYSQSRWKLKGKKFPNNAWVKCNGTSFIFDMDHALSEDGVAEGTELEFLCLWDGGLGTSEQYVMYGLVLCRKPGDGLYRERVGLWSTDPRREEHVLLWKAFQELNPQRVEIQ